MDSLLLPFDSPQITRRVGKAHADQTLGGLLAKMLRLYETHDRTDAELAQLLEVRESTISGRRAVLMQPGKDGAPARVEKAGYSRLNPRTGMPNHVWRLTR